jgi:hypothetical protein
VKNAEPMEKRIPTTADGINPETMILFSIVI